MGIVLDPFAKVSGVKITPSMGYSHLTTRTRKLKYVPRSMDGIKGLTDLQRKEVCILPGMAFSATKKRKPNYDYDVEQIRNLMCDAMIPAIAVEERGGVRDMEKATRLALEADEDAKRVYQSFFTHHWSYEKRAWCIWSLVVDLVNSGYWELDEGSAAADAFRALEKDVMARGIHPDVARSAEEQAPKLLKAIQAVADQHGRPVGYFAEANPYDRSE